MEISTKEVELSWDKLRKAKKLGWAQLRAGKLLKKLTSEIYGGLNIAVSQILAI